MNEGCATEVHYHIANRLHEKGMINDGTLLEILHSHTSVIFQPEFDDRRYSGHNPYALGFNMMEDIRRICVNPTAEDRAWFPDFAGNQDPWGTLKDAWANYRDESFILQYLSPELIRTMKLFTLGDVETNDFLEVSAIHNERGYRDVRHSLARQFDVAHIQPDIQVIDVDLSGDRRLIVQHRVVNGILLDDQTAKQSIVYMANLWGYEVCLQEVDAVTDVILREYDPVEPVLDLGEMG
jgi:spore cortex formation protein SpoVR/YcgB (stage V sporulation)